jgi:hypothetical protein
MTSNLAQLLGEPNSFDKHGLIAVRVADGSVRANVRHIVSHSPDGFELGYSGSGPADLALAALHALLPPLRSPAQQSATLCDDAEDVQALLANPQNWSGPVGPDKVQVSILAMDLHQEFKREFLASEAVTDCVQVPRLVMLAWVRRMMSEAASRVAGDDA